MFTFYKNYIGEIEIIRQTLLATALALMVSVNMSAQTTALTYQGILKDAGVDRWLNRNESSNSFFIYDLSSGALRMMIQNNTGHVGIGVSFPEERLHVNGRVRVDELGISGNVSVSRNAQLQLSLCSSSLRYKTNILNFSEGMSFINQLRPISYDWKVDGMHDVDFGAEDIAKIDPRFVTYNSKGEVEGVKYDRLSAAFVNTFKEQQAQIEDHKKQLEQQRAEINALKTLVCAQNPTVELCQEKKP